MSFSPSSRVSPFLNLRVPLAATLILLAAGCAPTSQDSGDTAGGTVFDGSDWPLGEVVAVEGEGLLAELETEQGVIHVMRLHGDHAEMGRQAGVLAGEQMREIWDTFIGAMSEDLGLEDDSMEDYYIGLLDGVWEYMRPHVPDPYLDFVEGMNQAAGYDEDACYTCRIIAISNISDLNFESITDGLLTVSSGSSDQLEEYYAAGGDPLSLSPGPDSGEAVLPPFHTCSFFAAWGDRTQDGHMLASRNLDWSADTGIVANKAITVFHPEGEDAGHPFVTFGYLGMAGALAGISSAGVAVAEVGSTGVLERLTGEPWVIRNLEVLEHAENLDEALKWYTNQVDDGFNRAPTIGYNLMAAWGDPEGEGASADAAVIEANGAMASIFRGGAEGTAEVHLFDEDGYPSQEYGEEEGANRESEAVEIDADGAVRLFRYEDGSYVVDDDGDYIEDEEGEPLTTGYPLTDALFRGDEAMSHANRRYQVASHGPQDGDGDGLMVESGSYRHRYTPSRLMLEAWETGEAYEEDGEILVEDNGGEPVLLGLDEGVRIARHVAMSSNILSVVYDATALEVRYSYESGSGEDWIAASDLDYVALDLVPALEYDAP